jgi:hypothetical protein
MAVSIQSAARPAPSPVRARTLVRDASAERRIDRDLRTIAEAVSERIGPRLRAVLLVGGYARHEGSVVARDGELGPYNDYDLIAVVDGGPPRFQRALAAIGAELGSSLGVEVDLWPVSARSLHRVPPTLFWLDVSLGGAELVAGDAEVLARLRPLVPRGVPLDECGRLLANRATGLALSNLEARDHDQRRARHAHKAVLAAGDVRLVAADRYRGTVAERSDELDRLALAPGVGRELAAAYRDATRFRARPDTWEPPDGDLGAWYETTVARVAAWHLGFEHWRVGSPVTPLAFARWRGRVYPSPPDVRRGVALLASVRAAAKRELPLFPWVGHPRERLARASVALAYGADDRACRLEAACLLGVDAEDAGGGRVLSEALLRSSERGG